MIELSASKLNVLADCPRCFWLQEVAGIPRPRGIFPSLPGGMDSVLKRYFDSYRKGDAPKDEQASIPPELSSLPEGMTLFEDAAVLKKWRYWKTALETGGSCGEEQWKLYGAIDDCLVTPQGVYYPLDYKTRGWAPKDSSFYQLQLDCYELLFQANGYKTAGKSFLLYFWPQAVVIEWAKEETAVIFNNQIVEVATDPQRAKDMIGNAVKTITSSSMPEPSLKCEYCSRDLLLENFKNTLKEKL